MVDVFFSFFASQRDQYFPKCDTSAGTMVNCWTPGGLRSGDWCSAPLLAAALLSLLSAGMHLTTAFPSWRLEEEAHTTMLVIGIRKEARSQVLHLSRNKRYTLTPEQLKWDKFKLTYKLLSFPTNLMNASDTRRGIARAFGLWSDVSPFSFREVPADEEADIKIGFYPVNHTDCWQSYLHHCFDGITGELAHAFFPPTGEIHFDDHEYWILGDMRFSWKKGVWLTDIVHVATHEIGHVLGLMHSMDPKAIMHLNATLTGRKRITQDEVWGLHRLYGCLDRLFICPAWARKGYCDSKRRLMQRHCPSSCDFCYATRDSSETGTRIRFPACRNLFLIVDFEDAVWLWKIPERLQTAGISDCGLRKPDGRYYDDRTATSPTEFPFPTAAPTPPPPRTKHKLVTEGKMLTFRCGKKIASKRGNIYWYKDGELLEHSHPDYISLKDDHITIVANAINEGTYTCIVKKKDKVLTNYSWRVRVRF